MNTGSSLVSIPLAIGLFAAMLAALEAGRWLGRRRFRRDPEGARSGLGAVEGSVFGLLALLIAFTFNGAATRFDNRRALIVQEANAVGTAWARLDMMPAEHQAPMRDLFRRYLDSRLEVYRVLDDPEAALAALAKSAGLQKQIWNLATTACKTDPGRGVLLLVLPPLNEMFDITTTRTMALSHHPPMVIYYMLFCLSIGCSMLAGYAMAPGRERSWTHMLGFALLTAIAIYVILDLEFPRRGLIRVDAADRALLELREGMK
jgi:hypothetical protein